MKKNQNVEVSIIIPVYFNQGSLFQLTKRLKKILTDNNPQFSYELIFVDDGSGDNSINELIKIREEDPEHVKIIKFTRNFGQISAIIAGYNFAKGEVVINISADLQDPPELIKDMLNFHFIKKYDIVICTREDRNESFLRKFTSKIFYKLIRSLSFINMPTGGFDYVLISDKVKKEILKTKESNPFWQGQILWTGYKINFIPYKREKREIGTSKWTFAKKIKMLIDGVMSYSYVPIRIMTILGIILSAGSFVYAAIIFISKLFGNVPVQGWAPIMMIILLLSGIQMLMLGIIGEYLWRTLDQVRSRQPYIIDKVYE